MIGQDPLDLGGQVAFVTGAGQGAGRAIALRLAKHNASGVAVNDFVPEKAAAVVAEIEALGVRAVAAPADVGDLGSVRAAIAKATREVGPVTLLVNNAGNAGPNAHIGLSPPFWETEPGDWDKFLRTHTFGVMNCCHAAIPGMIEQGRGRIVTIVSDAAGWGSRGSRLMRRPRRRRPASSARSPTRPAAAASPATPCRSRPSRPSTTTSSTLSSCRPTGPSGRFRATRSAVWAGRTTRPGWCCSCARTASWITGQTYPVNGGYSFAV